MRSQLKAFMIEHIVLPDSLRGIYYQYQLLTNHRGEIKMFRKEIGIVIMYKENVNGVEHIGHYSRTTCRRISYAELYDETLETLRRVHGNIVVTNVIKL